MDAEKLTFVSGKGASIAASLGARAWCRWRKISLRWGRALISDIRHVAISTSDCMVVMEYDVSRDAAEVEKVQNVPW